MDIDVRMFPIYSIYQITMETKSVLNYESPSVSRDDLAAGMKWDHNVAYYPYAEGIECEKAGDNYALDVVIPAEQTYVENSFCNGCFPMVAVSEDNDITFKNVCGGIKLQLKGTQKVTSIAVQGKSNEVLSGTAIVTAYTDETDPSITMTGTDAASLSVVLDCGEGVQLNESTVTEFIIVLPPVVFADGFTVVITDSEDNERKITAYTKNEVLRSSLFNASFRIEERYSNSDLLHILPWRICPIQHNLHR